MRTRQNWKSSVRLISTTPFPKRTEGKKYFPLKQREYNRLPLWQHPVPKNQENITKNSFHCQQNTNVFDKYITKDREIIHAVSNFPKYHFPIPKCQIDTLGVFLYLQPPILILRFLHIVSYIIKVAVNQNQNFFKNHKEVYLNEKTN